VGGLKLTKNGLSVLNSVPDVLSGKEPLGKRLAATVGKGSLETIKAIDPSTYPRGLFSVTKMSRTAARVASGRAGLRSPNRDFRTAKIEVGCKQLCLRLKR
jgi:hypothetical protein